MKKIECYKCEGSGNKWYWHGDSKETDKGDCSICKGKGYIILKKVQDEKD